VAVIDQRAPAAFGISPGMARAVADPWRLRILAEVSVRPLSPSQFVDELGGELTQVSRCFRQLAEWGYIEVVEERPGRRSGAAIEHVYRAIRRAHFDAAAWEDVPLGERASASISVLNAYQDRIRAAVVEGTFDQELDRHLSWDAVALDNAAWTEVGERLDALLDSLAEHEIASNCRLRETESEAIPATVGLAAFRSPERASLLLRGTGRRRTRASVAEEGEFPFAISPKLAKALSNRWRSRIFAEVSVRPMSPSEFVEEIGGSMTHVARCFRELAKWGFIEVIEERKGGRRGGGVERIYRSSQRPHFDAPTWGAFPLVVRCEISRFFLANYFGRIADAIKAGTFDADTDRHLSWKPIVIDRQAWTAISESLDEILGWLPDLETQSLERTDDLESLIPTTVGLASFRSPGKAQTFAD
jgi:DNA-binding transcriptional regulator GbsR (MarR family)